MWLLKVAIVGEVTGEYLKKYMVKQKRDTSATRTFLASFFTEKRQPGFTAQGGLQDFIKKAIKTTTII